MCHRRRGYVFGCVFRSPWLGTPQNRFKASLIGDGGGAGRNGIAEGPLERQKAGDCGRPPYPSVFAMTRDICSLCPDASEWWAKGDLNPHVLSDTGT